MISNDRPLTREALRRHLWLAAEILRGSMDASDYQNYILGLLFLKRMSDRFDEESEIIRQEGGDPEDRDEHQFFVPLRARWIMLQRVATGLGEELNQVMSTLEDANPVFTGVFTGIDFNDERLLGNGWQRDGVLLHLVQHFSYLTLRNDNLSEPEVLGCAYEDLVERLADEAGGRGGELSTPSRLARLMVEILQPREGMRIYDPACGSGGLLIQCAHSLSRLGGDARNLSLSGQEINRRAWTLCKMNMLLHGLPDARIERDDTLRNPKFFGPSGLMSFDIVLSNPPISLSHWGQEIAVRDPWGRFRFGIPPESRGDYAFLQHMIASLNPRGRMAVLMPQGALSREGQEGQIRRGVIEEDLVEAVIGLPSGVLYFTSAPPAILVINRAKPIERRGKILMLDASKQLEASVGQPYDTAGWQKLSATLLEFKEEVGFSRAVPLEEVSERGFNLQPGLYHRSVVMGERLDQLAAISKGRGRSGAGMGTKELPVIQGRDLSVRNLAKGDLARWPVPEDKGRAVLSQEGDILLQRIGRAPKSMLVTKDLAGILVSDTVYVIRLHEEYRSSAAYLVGFLNSSAGQEQLSIQAAVIPTLNLKELRALRVSLPGQGTLDLFERVRAVERDLLDRVQKALEIRSRLFGSGDLDDLETEMQRLSVEAEIFRESMVRAEDLDFQIGNLYPYVIAYRYRRLRSIFDDQRLYREQAGLLEVLLAFWGSLGLMLATSIASASDLAANSLDRESLEKLWEKGVAVGNWMKLFRTTAELLRSNASSPLAKAFAAMWSKRLRQALDRLVKLRNDDAHGRGPQTKQQLREAVEEFGSLLKESLKAGLALARYPIRLVETLSIPWRDTGAMHNTLVYRGDHPSLQREDIWYCKALTQGHLYIELEPGSWLSLYPLLSVEEVGDERVLYVIDSFDRSRSRVELKGLGQTPTASPELNASASRDFAIWLDDVFGPK